MSREYDYEKVPRLTADEEHIGPGGQGIDNKTGVKATNGNQRPRYRGQQSHVELRSANTPVRGPLWKQGAMEWGTSKLISETGGGEWGGVRGLIPYHGASRGSRVVI